LPGEPDSWRLTKEAVVVRQFLRAATCAGAPIVPVVPTVAVAVEMWFAAITSDWLKSLGRNAPWLVRVALPFGQGGKETDFAGRHCAAKTYSYSVGLALVSIRTGLPG
jgi:hypothetical protein